jgi:hypothetical protein
MLTLLPRQLSLSRAHARAVASIGGYENAAQCFGIARRQV